MGRGRGEKFSGERPIVVVHGGAGRWDVDKSTRERVLDFLDKLLRDVYSLLERDYSALDAVEYAVSRLEDSGLFNAGYGSALNIDGLVEMDAGIMDGSTMRAGAVAINRSVKNPVRLARIVMERTDHVLIGGEGSERLAEMFGLEKRVVNESILKRYREMRDRGEMPPYYKKNIDLVKKMFTVGDTVGAVALDKRGGLAAATSTGGIWMKLPGRIGDSPVPGAGFYADRDVACSATGIGETIMTVSLCRSIALVHRFTGDLYRATQQAFDELEGLFGENTAGVILVSSRGDIVMYYNTLGMARGYMSRDRPVPYTNL